MIPLTIGFLTSPAEAQITGVETTIAGFVGEAERGPLGVPTQIRTFGEFLTVFGGDTTGLANPYLAPSVEAFFTNGGRTLFIVRSADASDASLIGSVAAAGTAATGLQALAELDEIALLAVPGATTPAVRAALLAQCEGLADRFCLLDPASRNDVTAVLAERATLAASQGFGALYFPWIEAAPSGIPLVLPPSGFVAGIIARSDTNRGVWNSPAGPTDGAILGATGLSYAISSAEQELLNPAGVNAIRDFAAAGLLLFGARTLSSDPEWRFLSVRRLAAFVRESIEEGTAYALARDNDPVLWAQIESDVATFLQSLYLQGAFAGAQPEEAYFVRCDASTMTALELIEGRTIIQVGIAALRPAEFVVLEIVQQRGPPPALPSLRLLGLGWLLASLLLTATIQTKPGATRDPLRV